MAKTINREFQVFKCLCIILICVGHLRAAGFAGPFNLFPPYSYHVAAFAFIAGYFYKSKNDEHPLAFIRRKVVGLLVPTLVINALYGVLVWYLHRHGFEWTSSPYFHYELNLETLLVLPFTSGHQFNLNYTMWFVPALVMAEALYVSLRTVLSRLLPKVACEAVVAVGCVAAGATMMQLCGKDGPGIGWPLAIGRALFLLSFIALGRVYRRRVEPVLPDSAPAVMVVCCIVQLAITYGCGGAVQYTPSWLKFPHGALLTYGAGLCGILFLLSMAKLMAPVASESRLVNALADNTFPLMLHHRLFYFLLCGGMGLLSLHVAFLPGFDWAKFHTNEAYRYMPGDVAQFGLAYALAGIAGPLLIHFCWTKVKDLVVPKAGTEATPRHGSR